MKFKPHFVLGGSIVVSRMSTASFGMESVQLAPGPGPFRGGGPSRWVVVRRPIVFAYEEDHFLRGFQESAAEQAALRGTAAAQVIAAYGDDAGIQALVIEHLHGTSIGEIVRALRKNDQTLPTATVLDLAQRLLSLWATGVSFHVGVDELLLTPEGRVRADVELASMRARQTVGAAILPLMPNVSYISPEEVRGEGVVMQSGMFTLGLLIFEMLTGRHAFFDGKPSSMFEVLRALAVENPASLGEHRSLPQDVVAFVERLLSRTPADRFSSWAQVYDGLADLLGTEVCAPIMDCIPAALVPQPKPMPDLEGWQTLPHESWRELPIPAGERSITNLPPRPAMLRDSEVEYVGADRRPMFRVGSILVDADCVTIDEFERFRIAIGGVAGAASGAAPRTMVSYEDALAYTQWAGKRLPTDAEWSTCVESIGAARLRTGHVWEWTSTPRGEGWVVRGGRWRNALDREPEPANASFETDPAPDVGFRCVAEG